MFMSDTEKQKATVQSNSFTKEDRAMLLAMIGDFCTGMKDPVGKRQYRRQCLSLLGAQTVTIELVEKACDYVKHAADLIGWYANKLPKNPKRFCRLDGSCVMELRSSITDLCDQDGDTTAFDGTHSDVFTHWYSDAKHRELIKFASIAILAAAKRIIKYHEWLSNHNIDYTDNYVSDYMIPRVHSLERYVQAISPV